MCDHEKLLYISGFSSILTGCTLALPMIQWKIPRYKLTAHLEFVTNGLMLVAFGAVWKHLILSDQFKVVLNVLANIGSWSNGLAFCLASFLGQATELAPVANSQIEGEKPKLGTAPTALLQVCGVTLLSSLVITVYGLWQGLCRK